MNVKLFWHISLMLLAGVIFLFCLVGTSLAFIRISYSLVLVFFLPGYMILTAVFTTDLLGIPERIAYAVTLSIAVTALTGLLLNFATLGLQPITWASMLTVLSLLFGIVGYIRLRRVRVDVEVEITTFSVKFHEGLALIAAGVVVILALLLARGGAEQVSPESYTEFWMLPRDNNSALVVDLGIRNLETKPLGYHLELRTRNDLIEEQDIMSLARGETWETRIVIPPRYVASPYFSANLYRLDNPTQVYRQLIINHE